jgi:hypothetical protein
VLFEEAKTLGLFWDDEPTRRTPPKLLKKLVWEETMEDASFAGKRRTNGIGSLVTIELIQVVGG